MRVLITPRSEVARSCLECLVAWSRAGLLDPFCWWEAGPHSEDDSLEVVLVDRGREKGQLLTSALRGSRPEDIQLVAFTPLDSTSSVDRTFTDAVDHKVDVAREVLAYRPGSPVECAMVVAPSRIRMTVPASLFSPKRSANVYVAPEDRDDPEEVNALPESERRLPPHASHAIATVADLWTSTGRNGVSVLETLRERQPAQAPAPVQVVRCFTRGIDIGYLADHVAESVFLPGNSWPNPDPEKLDRLRNAEGLIDAAAKSFMDKHSLTLGPREFEPLTLPDDQPIGLWEAFKRLFWVIVGRIRRKPIEMIAERVNRAHNRLAELLEKMDGGATGFTVERWERVVEDDGGFGEFREDSKRLRAPPEGPVEVTWNDLRRLAFSLIDGKPWPEDIATGISRSRNKQALVTDPFLIAPDPEPGYNLAVGNRRTPACDPLNEDPSMVSKKEEVNAVEGAVPRGDGSPEGAKFEEGQESAEEGKSEQGGDLVLEAARDTEQGPSELEPSPSRSSLLWKVGLSIARKLKKVESEAASLKAELEAEMDPESEEAKEREEAETAEQRERSRLRLRGLLKTMIVSLVLAVIAAGLAFELPLFLRVPVLVVLPILWLVAIVFKARNLLIEERKEEREFIQRTLDRYNRRERLSLREEDAERIADRYEEFMDWAEIIGWFVHSPWIGEPLEKIDVDAPVPPGSRPLAFQMVTGVLDKERVSEIARVSQTHVFQRGWLNDLYSSNQRDILKESSDTSTVSTGGAAGYSGDPAADTSDDPDSPRRSLLMRVRTGDSRRIGDNVMTQDLLKRLDDLKIDEAALRVEEDDASDAQAEPLPLSPSWFSPPSNLDSLMRKISPPVVRVTASLNVRSSVGTGALLPGAETVVTALHVVEGAESISIGFDGSGEIEALVEEVEPENDLVVLRLAEPLRRQPIEFAEPGGLEVGSPVVTLGYRNGGDPLPILSWGVITGTNRTVDLAGLGDGIEMVEANYRSALGSSGAPVFDLAGRVVGLHVGSKASGGATERATFLSHALPAQVLQDLIKKGSGVDSTDVVWEPRRSGLSAVASNDRRRAVDGVKPSEFFAELIGPHSGQAFLPDHWDVGSGEVPNGVETVISEPVVIDEQGEVIIEPPRRDVERLVVSQCCDGNAFFRSLRLMVHRTDMAEPALPEKLSFLTEERADDSEA